MYGVAELSARQLESIQHRSEGHPLQVIHLLEEIRCDPQAIHHLDPPVPRSIEGLTRDQLANLPEVSQMLLGAIAVLDTRCPLAAAAFTANVANPLDALEPLIKAALVRWWPREPPSPVMIASPLQREAIYHLLEPGLRRRLHARAADAVSSEASLMHRTRAAQGTTDPELAAVLVEAAHRWIAEGYLERAATYFLWASDVESPGVDAEQHLLVGVSLLQRQHQFDRVAALMTKVRACRPSPLRDCVLGRQALHSGDAATACELLTSAAMAVEADPNLPSASMVKALANMWLAATYSWLGDSQGAREVALHALGTSVFGPRVNRGTEFVYVHTYIDTDGPIVAWEKLHDLVDLPEHPSATDPKDSVLLVARGALHLMLGAPDKALADLTSALRSGHYAGINDVDEVAGLWMALGHYVLGNGKSAAEHAAEAVAQVVSEQRITADLVFGVSAFLAAQRGQLDLAEEHATAAAVFVEGMGLTSHAVFPALGFTAIAQTSGNHDAVLAALDSVIGQSHLEGYSRVHEWLWRPMLVEALIGTLRFDEADSGLQQLDSRIREGYRSARLAHSWLSGRLAEARGDHALALRWYERAVHTPAAMATALSRARAQESYGILLALSGDLSTASGLLNSAFATYGTINAPFFLKRCQESAAELGINLYPAFMTTLLTQREQAVAQLVAQGLTNEDVARRLRVSVKTVEAHLTKVYAKLNVSSRQNLHIKVNQQQIVT
jgi:DNA-binding CsgD family transcriptional regulator